MNLYVSDLDGTLLGADSRVSATTAAVINALVAERGINFTVATSRTPATVVPLMAGIDSRLPFITMSGAALWNPLTSRMEQVNVIPPDVVEAVIGIMERYDLRPFIYCNYNDTMIHTHHCGSMSDVEHTFVEQRSHLPLKRYFLDDSDYRNGIDNAMLIFAMSTTGNLNKAYRKIKDSVDCHAIFYHDAVNPQWELLEVYRTGCSKAAAVRHLAERIEADRIVVFGDNLNDIDMLSNAQHAVAVENALPQVKAIAHEVTLSNTEDGVARWLQLHT